ncbi:MAG TPA: hypothetical protein VNE38_17620 [Ktedonobacteraceae bacterium]|nr:hypothetical protein [Ktedonobacteraceae bacterium]
MPSKPLHAFLDTNFQSCRKHGTSTNREHGLKVTTTTLEGETIIFFHTDCNEGRECLRITNPGYKVCDYLIYYSKEDKQNEIACLLELKGTNLEDAKKQVTETHRYLNVLLSANFRSGEAQSLRWRICICLHSHAPSTNQRIRDELIRDYGKKNIEIKHGIPQHNIGLLLRREPE